MKKSVLLAAFLSLITLPSFCQNGIIGAGFTNGWTNPTHIVSFEDGAGGTRIKTLNPRATGNQFFRLVRNSGGTDPNKEYGPFGCVDANWSSGGGFVYYNMPGCASGAFYINCPNITDNYVFV